jgi:hypothetical protein
LLVLWRARRGDHAALPLVLFVAAAYVAILVNARFYPQYFLQILAPLAPLSAAALVSVGRAVGPWGRVLRIAVVAFLALSIARHTPVARFAADVRAAARFAAGALDRERYYLRFGGYDSGGDFSLLADDRLARYIAERTTAAEGVYIYGGEALVLFLADRRSPSRFIWNDPFTAGAYRGRYTHADVIRELEADPPRYFIVLRHDGNLVDPVDSLTHFHADAGFEAWVRVRFREVGWFEDFLVFEAIQPGDGRRDGGVWPSI